MSHRKLVILLTLVAMISATLTVLNPSSAAAAGTVLFQNDFDNRTVDGTGTVSKPSPASGTNVACLTAAGNSATLPLLTCAGSQDAQGSGKLRLTNSTTNQVGGVFGTTSFPTSNGLDVTFNSYQWGGGAADGLSFLLAAVDPANPAAPTTIGPSGGSLGYSPAGSVRGLTNGYLGVGLDVFGNYSSTSFQGSGCTNVPNIVNVTPGAVVVRGPGNGLTGYCGLTTTWDGTGASRATLRATTRAASVVPVQVLINPTGSAFTSDSGVSVSAGSYKVVVKPVGQATKTLSGTLPTVAAGLYPSASWLNAGGVPKQLAFAFVGSTGSVTDVHEVDNAKVLTFNPVPQLGVSTISYAAATSQPGDPVSYRVSAKVLAGANETSPISVTQTVPTGVVPAGAYGTGWVCQAPVGQTVTCTTSASSFTNGTTLPEINVVAIVTGANVTSAIVQSNSTVRASSADANPGTDTSASAGTLPTPPSGFTVTPAIGPVAGGGTVIGSGSSTTAPTAIEIGTVAEQKAGTPVVLLPCPGAAAAGCFSISGNTVVISSMPARASAGTVTVTVVTLGVADADNYVYADRPGTIATPTAVAAITSAAVSWVAPATNGSAITGYVVTPYLGGVAQTPVSYDATATTRTLTGLTAAGSYRFTVSAINGYGTSTVSPQSVAVIPYALPNAPATPTVTAGSLSVKVTWSAPNNNGSAITGYVVTPYIGTVAQTAQTFTSTATTQSVTGLTAGTSYTFTVAAKNAAGTGPASAKSTGATPNQAPSLVFAAPPAGEVGVAYNRTLTVTNGTAPFAWSVSSGSLPAGLTLNATSGLLSGTPTAAGSYPFVVSVTDTSGLNATKSVTLVIAAAPTLAFTPADGEVSVPYAQQPTVTGGTGPFVWSVSAGSLPAGLTLSTGTGAVSGTPTASGSFPLTITATDAYDQTASRTVTLVVVALPSFTTTAPTVGQVGVGYAQSFDVTGGSLPLVWSVSAGALPAGLTLNTGSGAVSGIPTAAGSSSFTIAVADANGKTATRAVTIVIGAGPLVITKTANAGSAAAGGVVSYTITITNTGTAVWTGATLSDPLTGVLDDATYGGNASATSGTLSYAASTLGWSGNVGAGATVTITYAVTVNNPDVGNKVLSNTVSSSTVGTNCAAGSADSRCTATVGVLGLSIVKTVNPATTTPGGIVTFTIVVTNSGQAGYPNATLTDSLAGVLDDAAYNTDGTATAGNVTYAGSALTWAGALAVGASATISYSVTVTNPDTGDRSLTGTVVSPSAGSSCPSANPAPSCTATATVLVPALVISNTVNGGAGITTPGSTVGYTVTVSNTGQTPYTGSVVTIALAGALDDATYNTDAAASSGVVGYSAGTLTWTGNVAIGAVVTITGSVTVRDPDPGDRTLTSVATSAAAGSTCPAASSNPACTTTVQVRVPQLLITTSADVSTTTPGSTVHHVVSVTNSGQTAYTSATLRDDLAGVLDDASYNSDAASTTGTVSFASGVLTWTGNLAIGASATITYSTTVHQPDTGDRNLRHTVSSATPGNNCGTGGSDPRCTSSVAVQIPALDIGIVADAATTSPGAVVHYTVTVRNTGESMYNALAVTLDLGGALDDADYNYDATITTGDLVTKPDGTVDWILALAPGASATGTVSVTVKDPAAGDKSLVVKVVSDAQGSSCATGSAQAGCSSTVGVLLPGLTITKAASTSTASPGGTVGYTITVTNNGQTTYPAAGFTDSLATVLTDATYNADATATAGTVTYGARVVSWTGSLAPGAIATINYSVTILDPDPGDKLMTNTVVSTAAGNNCATGSTDPRCTSSVDVLVPALTIRKTANKVTTTPGATVGYTVVVTNSGPTAYAPASFADPLTGVLDDATYNDDAAATAGSVSFAGATVGWTGALASGASATITYSVTVRSGDTGDNLLTNTVGSTSSGNNCLATSIDSRCTSTVPIARLVIAQAYTEATTTPGSLIHLSATFTNTGKTPYTGITISSPSADTVDDAIPTGDQTASSGTLVLSSTAITWTGNIPVGATITITGTLTVQDPDPGNKIITGTLVSTAVGNNCPSGNTDPRCTATSIVQLPGLTITKTANAAMTVPGGTVAYTITVANSGQTAYAVASITDPLIGLLDDANYNGDASATRGAVTFASPTLTWTGALAVGETATITYTVTTDAPATGDKTMINPVSSSNVGSTCPPASGNPACHSTVVILTPALTIVKTADVANATLGSIVHYTIKVTNSGQTPQAASAFVDLLDDVLDDATYNADATASSGAVGYSNGILTWSGSLNPGSASTITYSVTINNPATGDREMDNTVTSNTTGNNCTSASTDPRCTADVAITNAVALTYTKTSSAASTVAGGVVRYTVTVANASSSAATANFTDPLAGILDDATFNNDATASIGAVSYAAPDLSWTGSVPANTTATISYTVTTHPEVTGDQTLTSTVSSSAPAAGNNCLAGSVDPRCINTVLVAGLRIEQHYTESTTTPGSLIHLSATFTNTGAMPYTGITISSPSADTVDDAIPTGDQIASSGTLVLSSTAITWTGDIAVGATITIAGTLTVTNPDLGNKIITGTLVSTALGNNCPSGGTDPACTALSTVLLPALTITKTADATFVVPNGVVGYTITVANSGQTAYVGASFTDSMLGILDDASYGGNATADSGSVSYDSPTLTWTGDLAVGQTATITYSVTAFRPATGDKTMVNPVSSSTVGSTCPPASGNAACRSTVVVLTPALTIATTASRSTAVPGDSVTYTVVATNTGQTSYMAAGFSIPLSDILDDASYAGGATTTIGSVTVTATGPTPAVAWTANGAFAPGATATISYTVTVADPVSGNFRLSQTASSTNQGNTCPVNGTDPRCTTSVPIAGLHIVNTADAATTMPTSVVHYTGTFTNTGQVPYTGITIADSFVGALDDATYNGDAAATSGEVIIIVGSGRISWTGDVPVGATVTITGSVTVNNPDAGDKLLTTRITTDTPATNCPTSDPTPAAALCATSVPVLTPKLTLTKAADTSIATPGSTIHYTVTVANTGQTPYLAATVTDSLVDVRSEAGYNGDATADVGAVIVDGQGLKWTGDLAVGQTAVIHYGVTVNDPDLGDKLISNRVTSDDLGSTCPTGRSAPACSSLVTVLVPAIDVSLTADRTTTTPGGVVTYTVIVTNAGQTGYVGASIAAGLGAVLDDAVYNNNATSTSGGTVSFSAQTLTWTGDLALGASTTITYSVTVNQPDGGDRTLTTTVSSAAQGSRCTVVAPCTNTVSVLLPGLSVSMIAAATTATPGDEVGFTITVRNTGETPYLGTDVSTDLTAILDDASFDGTVAASTGLATYTAPTLTWTGSLPVGASAIITFAATVRDPDPGNKVLAATVLAPAVGSTCLAGSTDPACSVAVTVLVPALTITKSTPSPTTTPGGMVQYMIIVENTGETAYPAATISDSLLGALSGARYNADASVVGGGTIGYADSTLTWTGALPVGASATIRYSMTVDGPDPGDKLMMNSVTSTSPGSSCPPSQEAPGCSVLVRVLVPQLAITKTADSAVVSAGDSVRYTITLTNTGETAYLPASFTDPLTDVLDDADYAADATASSGTVQYTNSTLVWSGALEIGATATITYSVNTHFPTAGDHTLTNTVQSASAGSTCGATADSRCTSAVRVLVPALTITKTADASSVVAGGTVRYTIVATNTGEADYSAASFGDTLTDVLDDGTYNADATATAGGLSYAAGVLTWTGALQQRAAVLVSYSVTVTTVDTGDAVLTNRVSSSSIGSTCIVDGTDPACTTTTPVAAGVLTLQGLTPSFTLAGLPDSTVTKNGAVTMTVITNSFGGYTVTARATSSVLTGATPGNPDTIPVGRLGVRNSGTVPFTELAENVSHTVFQKSFATGPGGDAVSNDYQIHIPFVAADTYSTTIEYIATTQ